jgi:hypothetical protein
MIDYSLAQTLFEHGVSWLQTLGFGVPRFHVESSSLEGDILLMSLSNDKAGRVVDISYTAEQGGRPGAIAVLIKKDDGQRFSLETWAKTQGMSGQICFSTLNNPQLNGQALVERFCEDFRDLAQFGVAEILSGRSWQEVPMDWKGYR